MKDFNKGFNHEYTYERRTQLQVEELEKICLKNEKRVYGLVKFRKEMKEKVLELKMKLSDTQERR